MLGEKTTIPENLDSLIDKKFAFIKKRGKEMIPFLNQMRELKKMIVEQAFESATYYSSIIKKSDTDQAEDTGAGKRKRAAKAKDAAIVEDELDSVAVAAALEDFKKFLAVSVSPDALENPIDGAYCGADEDVEDDLTTLQRVSRNFQWRHSHQQDPCAALNFLQFTTSGRRIRLLGKLSEMILTVESTLPPPAEKVSTVGRKGLSAVYYKQKQDDFSQKKMKPGVKLTYLPWVEAGPRFVRYDVQASEKFPTTDALKSAFKDRKAILDAAKPDKKNDENEDETEETADAIGGVIDLVDEDGTDGTGAQTQKGKGKGKGTGAVEEEQTVKGRGQILREGRESDWGRMYFKHEIFDRAGKYGYHMSSFSSDGNSSYPLRSHSLTHIQSPGISLHILFVKEGSNYVTNTKFELTTEKYHPHVTWEGGTVSMGMNIGILKGYQVQADNTASWFPEDQNVVFTAVDPGIVSDFTKISYEVYSLSM